MRKLFLYLLFFSFTLNVSAQSVEEDQLGAWYMYFYNASFGDSGFGVQGDFQYRAWDAGGDMEQLLLRSGFTYKPKKANILFTLGYANITSGDPGESTGTSGENRIYQEALIPQKLGDRFLLTHRFRSEQRWVQDQDFRTRFRYNIFVNVLLNKTKLEKNAVYLALYNEIFINGQTDIGDGKPVQYFDRNRTYLGLGYSITDKLRVQGGWMQQTTENWAKGQAQISAHHTF